MVRTSNGMGYREIFERHPGNPIITVEDILWGPETRSGGCVVSWRDPALAMRRLAAAGGDSMWPEKTLS